MRSLVSFFLLSFPLLILLTQSVQAADYYVGLGGADSKLDVTRQYDNGKTEEGSIRETSTLLPRLRIDFGKEIQGGWDFSFQFGYATKFEMSKQDVKLEVSSTNQTTGDNSTKSENLGEEATDLGTSVKGEYLYLVLISSYIFQKSWGYLNVGPMFGVGYRKFEGDIYFTNGCAATKVSENWDKNQVIRDIILHCEKTSISSPGEISPQVGGFIEVGGESWVLTFYITAQSDFAIIQGAGIVSQPEERTDNYKDYYSLVEYGLFTGYKF